MDQDQTVNLVRCLSEIEAAAIVAQLREQGIKAEVSGGITGGFRAEAPGSIWVLVRRGDVERARAILDGSDPEGDARNPSDSDD